MASSLCPAPAPRPRPRPRKVPAPPKVPALHTADELGAGHSDMQMIAINAFETIYDFRPTQRVLAYTWFL